MTEQERSGFSVPKGKKVCSVCGEIKRTSHFEGDSERCTECNEKMLGTHIKWYFLPIMLIFAVSSVIAVYLTSLTVPFIKTLNSADSSVESGCLHDAFDIFENTVIPEAEKTDASIKEKFVFLGDTKIFVPGTKTFEKYCKIKADSDSEYEAGELAESILDNDFIKGNEVFSEYVSVRKAYDKVFSKMQKINETYPFTSAEDLRYDEIMTAIEDEKQKCASDSEKGYFEYFKASVTSLYYGGKDELYEKVKRHLDEMLRYLPGEYQVYGSTLVSAAFDMGDYDKAEEIAKFVIEKNRNITEAYEWLAEAYYKKGDAEKTFATIEELNKFSPSSPTYYKLLIKYNLLEGNTEAADKASFDGDSENSELADTVYNMYLSGKEAEITRKAKKIFAENIDFTVYQCALLLLQDDAATAFEVAYNYAYYYAYYYAYLTGDTSLLSQGVINMTTLCAELVNDKSVVDEISGYGMCDETTLKVIKGELTLEDVFVSGKAEII